MSDSADVANDIDDMQICYVCPWFRTDKRSIYAFLNLISFTLHDHHIVIH